ncbi:phage tail tape measure protein [Aeromonas hydrophila]|uniref:phage tail tape measure protein n=1 Tax=Aeromonas hydrophila TaxID=644 RepID=UPI001B3A7270|nr:phage tail tape measure protein [Aeromonas hydrophila]MBQ4675592.1 phage tail tape measure protein [Aeromonas hydrophila]MBW3814649.1 phage tail tape measure protein [Aeromonas hydrophila]MCF7680654.1 phage tail tape measure protein [Aeromonas hydrophila]MCF7693562.1 phage tail tape measure protein [Aeromonas hydrophila]MCF7774433.1 phage tail tape measure protein [Aeromonas hydrophila]
MANEFQLKALITGVDKLSPALKGIRKNIKGWQRDLQSAGEGAPAIAAGLAAAVGGSLAAFAQSENAATGLKVAMMDAAGSVGPEFKKINDLAVGLGNKLPGTTADFQNMMTMLQRQGLSAETVLGGVGEATAYLAVQLGKAPAAAAEFAAKMQDATGTASKDMMSLFDTIQKAFYMGVDDNNMLQFFGKASSAMKLVSKDGLKAAQAMAPLAIMLDQASMAGESAGNAMRKVMTAGFDRKKMKEANQMIRSMGLKGTKLDFTDGKGEFGGLDNMFAQLDKLKGLTEGDKLTVLGKIFGTDSETQQALKTIIDKGKAGYDEIQQRMARQASLQQRVGAQLGTLGNLWDAMTGTAVNGLAAIGGAFQGEAKDTVTWLGDMAEKFSAFAAANPEVIRGLVGLAAGFAAFKMAALAGSIAMGGFGTALKVLSGAVKVSPLGIALTALQGLAMVAGLIIANWGTIGPWLAKVWQSITVVASAAWESLKQLFFNFHPLGIVIQNWGPISGWLSGLWGDVQGKFSLFTAFLKRGLLEFTPLGAITENWGPISAWFSELWGSVTTGFGWAWEFLKQGFLDFHPLGIIIKNWEPIVAWFKGMWERIQPYLQPLMDGMSWVGDKVGGVMDGVGSIWQRSSDTLGAIWSEGKGGLGASSPLAAVSPAVGANSNTSAPVSGEMVVRFENAPQNLRVDEGKTSPGWSMSPDVGYSRYAK